MNLTGLSCSLGDSFGSCLESYRTRSAMKKERNNLLAKVINMQGRLTHIKGPKYPDECSFVANAIVNRVELQGVS